MVLYPSFTPSNKAYCSVSQRQGKEMRNLVRVLLGVFTTTMSRMADVNPPSFHQKVLCQKAILCVRYITDFVLTAQYKVHTPATIQSMNDYLSDFHKNKVLVVPTACRLSEVLFTFYCSTSKPFTHGQTPYHSLPYSPAVLLYHPAHPSL